VVQRLSPCVSTAEIKRNHYSRDSIALPHLRAGAKSRRVKALRTT
jgi:hypothetical protein